MPDELRARILSEFAKYTGQVKPAAFFQRTQEYIPGIERFHHLIAGIYKPAWSKYALCISMRQHSIYADKDEYIFLEDGRWLMNYSPRKGGLDISDNAALVNCMQDRVPVGVIVQFTGKRDPEGSRYRVLGLGMVTNFNSTLEVFEIEGADWGTLESVTSIVQEEELRYQIQLYARLTNEFRLFEQSEAVKYSVSAPKRAASFRKVLLEEYHYSCAICNLKFRLGDLVEAEAGHIVPKKEGGTDDPRNGLAICHTHHWAFDNGIFFADG